MRKFQALLLVGAGLALNCAMVTPGSGQEPSNAASASDASTAQPEFVPARLIVPEGYTVELAAAPPLVAHPLMASFDDQGRLYVAANAGVNLPREELERQLPNFIQRLEDTDGDGVFDRATVFADKMTFPQGALWYRGSLYVASSGAIWKLTDTDDDGVADVREKLVGDFGYTGNAADVHGCFLGPEGRIYWCEGRHGHEFRDAQGNLTSRGRAARIFSCRPDGTDVQTFCTGGMDNPVEILFSPEGEMLGTVNLMYSQPRGDCLVHWQHAGVYPREDFADSLDGEFLRTGDLLTEVHNFGHVALSGLCTVRGAGLGSDLQDQLLITVFNTNRLLSARPVRSGASYQLEELRDFVVAESGDFRPTDVLQDADGSILLIDTGGWFRIGCPESQVAKPDVRGAIYRIRRTNATPPADPRGQDIAWQELSAAELIQLLEDARPAVQEQALDRLALRMSENSAREAALLAFQQASLPLRQQLIWAAARADEADTELLLTGLEDPAPRVRQTAARAWFDLPLVAGRVPATERFLELLEDDDPNVRRVAAVVLGRTEQQTAPVVSALFAALQRNRSERLVEHALLAAIMRMGDREAVAAALLSADEATSKEAALVLEQLRQKERPLEETVWLEIPAPALPEPLSAEQQAHLLASEAALPDGDSERGLAIFRSEQAACSKCHRVQEDGGRIGPNLSQIGRSRNGRDLLESILFPSASFARGFESYQVLTSDGRVHSGIILGEGTDFIELGIDKETATRIAASEIDEIHPSPVSLMPHDLEKQLTPAQLADLIAYLRSLQ